MKKLPARISVASKKKSLNLALQGGGAHGAFTCGENWGRVHISGKHQLKGLKCEPVPNFTSCFGEGFEASQFNLE
jgi:hypothetical protein